MITNQLWVKMECKADHSPPPAKKMTESAIHNQILNNDLTVVSCVYEPLLQPGVLSLHSSQSQLMSTEVCFKKFVT